MHRVVILGGGFGGVATARRLRELLPPDDEVVLVDWRDHFMVGFRKTWALVGETTMEAGQGRLADLERHGIRVKKGTIMAIAPGSRTVDVDGTRIEADALVVALGAALDPDAVPGFREHALNVYDPNEIPRAAEALRAFEGGRVVVAVFGTPYKCPPAPYEIALAVSESFRKRGVEASVEVCTPLPMSLPVVGESGCGVIESRMSDQGVGFFPNHKALRVEDGEILFTAGRRKFDLLLGIAPHRAPGVVVESGLTGEGDWVAVDPRTLETPFPGVYAIGDVVQIMMANGKPLPKAGVFAEGMGLTVAERIAAEFSGRKPEAIYKGEGGCFLEVGNGEAMMVSGWFLAEPKPEVSLSDASAAHMEEKRAFETERLKAWFGA